MTDTTTLADLGVGPNGTIQLEMQSADPVNTPIKAYRPRQEYHMPDVITVRVQTGKFFCLYINFYCVIYEWFKFHYICAFKILKEWYLLTCI